jgi:PBP1b-binding outer membrane lipoprotein LpoB
MKKIGLVALFALLLAGCDDGGEKKAQENLRKAEAALEHMLKKAKSMGLTPKNL